MNLEKLIFTWKGQELVLALFASKLIIKEKFRKINTQGGDVDSIPKSNSFILFSVKISVSQEVKSQALFDMLDMLFTFNNVNMSIYDNIDSTKYPQFKNKNHSKIWRNYLLKFC